MQSGSRLFFAWSFGAVCGAFGVARLRKSQLFDEKDSTENETKSNEETAPNTPQNISNDQKPPLMSLTEIDAELRSQQRSGFLNFGSSDLGLDFAVSSLSSNNPMEDRQFNALCDKETAVFGVLDGHSGWNCAEVVSKYLPNAFLQVKQTLHQKQNSDDVSSHMELIIKSAFQNLDNQILSFLSEIPNISSLDTFVAGLLPALSGCCAAMLVVEQNKTIHAANVGDCRVILGTKSVSGDWETIELTHDQRGDIESEVERLKLEHPYEETTVVSRGRILGRLQPSRSFGDGRYKYPRETHENLSLIRSRSIIQHYRTPPYVSVIPEVHSHQISPRDKFIVIASDGLWDEISSSQSVEIVGDFVDKCENNSNTTEESQIMNFFGDDSIDNVATHLIREALGGSQEKLSKTLSIPRGRKSRRNRDDISVTVLKFRGSHHSEKNVNTFEGLTQASTKQWGDAFEEIVRLDNEKL